MVFSSAEALTFTNNSIVQTANTDIQNELNLCEGQIRNATGFGISNILYNANIIGNPIGPPQISTNLTSNQSVFYSLLVGAGYLVDLDNDTGRWAINWGPIGPESQVNVYSLRTMLNPSGISAQTILVIENYFAGLIPIVHTNIFLNGAIDETVFGGGGTHYEFTIVIDQQPTNFSTALVTILLGQGLGYSSGNLQIYKMI